MQWAEYYETADYVREAEASLSRRLGGGLRKSQLKELNEIIGRIERFMGSTPDSGGRGCLEQLKRKAAACLNSLRIR